MNDRNEYHYLPIDDRAAEWGFYLTTTGRLLEAVTPHLPQGVHPDMYMFNESPAPDGAVLTKSPCDCGRILPEFQVVYIMETHTVFESDETGVVEFHGPTLLFLFPGVWHRYRPVGSAKGWFTARWVGFNGDLPYRLTNRKFITPETAVCAAARPRRLAVAFDRLIDRVAANPGADPILLSMHAMDLLADCIESAQDGMLVNNPIEANDADEDNDKLVARMLDLIWSGSHRGLNMDQMCKTLGVNRRTVERRFRAARGHSLLTEVNLCRCQRARHFLETTDLPIKNVSWLAGFNNSEQLRTNFQQLTGMPPDQYRRTRRRERR